MPVDDQRLHCPHKVVAEAALLNLNPFDQWGVEFGKTLAQSIERGQAADPMDASTQALLSRIDPARRDR